ncbi:MAG: ABC transporter substrate-binding protein [Eubacteriales bacterium]|nr:ABC transporter substrate-binding protein [Eubacteriales bacterium]MDY2934520.1 ABC transporter substrate-binding protein [Anaerovoracaceae bacterium]
MKKLLAVILTVAMVFAFTACGGGSTDENGLSTVEAGKLHMATNAAFPPYEMTNDSGGFEGIDVEIAEKIAAKLGLELVVDDMDFSSVLTSVQGGKADIAMAGLTVTPDRQKNVDFTDSYATGVQVVIVPEDSDIKTIDDLAKDKMIGTQEGTTGFIYCSDTPENGGFGEDHVIAYTNGATAIQALLAGKVNAVVIDSQPAKEFVAANDGLKILETEFVSEDYAIGVSKDNPELLEAVNNALKELIEDGTVQEILDKYIKAE